MLKGHLESKTSNELAMLLYKADKQFWHWANRYYKGGHNPNDGFRMERWRRICKMIYDEMYAEERIIRNR